MKVLMNVFGNGSLLSNNFLLMCKDVPVYDILNGQILDDMLVPGALLKGTMSYDEWMQTRYSANSNVVARRLMMRALGTDNHNLAVKPTRALSLSDCYWIKAENDPTLFEDVTPYLNREWDESDKFAGGSLSTLFVNGAASKKWDNASTLRKFSSRKEMEVYDFCGALDIFAVADAWLEGNDLLVRNFTSPDYFFEAFDQSGQVGREDFHLVKGMEVFGKKFVILMIIDYVVEHDDRHSGNFGWIRNSNTGEYLGMAPYFDFDWCWSGGVYPLPDEVFASYRSEIIDLCRRAISAAPSFEHSRIIDRRARELLSRAKEGMGGN